MKSIHVKAILSAGVILILCLSLTACTEKTDKEPKGAGYLKITAEDAKKRMDAGQDTIVLDVRTKEEYEENHIKGAILIPNETITGDKLKELPDLDQEILVYCRSGNRSEQAAKKLIQAGYTNVYDFGGINNWPYDTVSGQETASGDGSIADEGGLFGIFESETLDGEKVNQDIFAEADVTMVNIWGTFCGPCIREMPDLGEISRNYADKGVQIVGIIADVNKAGNVQAEEIVEQTKADYTHIVSAGKLDKKVKELAQFVPTTVFLDKNGKQTGELYAGAKSQNDWEKILDKVLEEVQQ